MSDSTGGSGFTEKGPHEVSQRLDQRAVRDVPLVDVELPGCEVPPVSHDRLLQLLDQTGLANAGKPRDQERTKLTASDLLVLAKDDLRLAVAADHPRNERHPVGGDAGFQGKLADRAGGRVLVSAPHEVGKQAARRLVALLRLLEQEPGNDRAHDGGDPLGKLVRPRGLLGQVGMDQLQRIA